MNSLGWINLAVVFFLFAVIHEGSTQRSSWTKIIFRARQAEARRNRIKYKDVELSNDNALFASFVLSGQIVNGFKDFVMPELSDDGKLEQKFQRTDNEFFLMCRKKDRPPLWISPQEFALDYLGAGRPFFYSAADRKSRGGPEHNIFTSVATPLSAYERAFHEERNPRKCYLCSNLPMPGIRMHMYKARSLKTGRLIEKPLKYGYGKGALSECVYFEFGIESVPYDQNGREALKDRLANGEWAIMYNICYDKKNFVTGFTKHTIYSGYITERKLNFNLDFSRFESQYIKGISMEKLYDLAAFPQEFKSFNLESNYLVRTRLIPEFDVLTESWQHGINTYFNYAPMWRSVNMGQWLKVEQDIRHMAYKLNKELLTVYTGVYYKKDPPRLYFIDDNIRDRPSTSKKKTTDIYQSIPIPSVFYKYVHSKEAGIVFITANGVSGALNDIECKNVCDQFGWHFTEDSHKHRNEVEFGETKCCRPKDFFSQEKFELFIPDPPSKKNSPITKILTAGGLQLKPNEEVVQIDMNQLFGQHSGQDRDTFAYGPDRPVPVQATNYVIGGELTA